MEEASSKRSDAGRRVVVSTWLARALDRASPLLLHMSTPYIFYSQSLWSTQQQHTNNWTWLESKAAPVRSMSAPKALGQSSPWIPRPDITLVEAVLVYLKGPKPSTGTDLVSFVRPLSRHWTLRNNQRSGFSSAKQSLTISFNQAVQSITRWAVPSSHGCTQVYREAVVNNIQGSLRVHFFRI